MDKIKTEIPGENKSGINMKPLVEMNIMLPSDTLNSDFSP